MEREYKLTASDITAAFTEWARHWDETSHLTPDAYEAEYGETWAEACTRTLLENLAEVRPGLTA